jgi:hypothetical protein
MPGGSMKRKISRLRKKRKIQRGKRFQIARVKRSPRKHRTARQKRRRTVSRRTAITDPRIARALGVMRREGASASKAAHDEQLKLKTFRKGAGRSLYRSGPGKPWKARSEDQLHFLMTILTRPGPLDVIVSNSRERKLLSKYNLALRMFRAGEDGAEAALKALEGKKVAGHTLITDIAVLIELEEAGQLDFEGFYVAIGTRS